MKKYEYKYVKTEAKFGQGVEQACEQDEAMLTGYGLDGWRVHSVIQTYYLMEREINE